MNFKKVIKLLSLVTILTLLVFSMVGCDESDSSSDTTTDESADNTPAEEEPTQLSGTITIAGSTSVQPISEVLAEEFMDLYPDVRINVQGGGSSAGVKAADEGAADIGASSRDLKDEEKHLNEIVIAKDGIAVVVHPSNNVDTLSMEQVRDIFAGSISNWSEVGGENVDIIAVTREEGSGTRGAFEEIVMGSDNPISSKAIVQSSTGAISTTVAGDPNAIGYISLAALNNDVKTVKVDGIEVTKENILSGSYKVARPFLYLTKGEPEGLVKAFIDFILSAEGQELCNEEGLVAVK
ncbi:phosphate ABC transporter substrate-binding protein [Candidatus Contubernalis alkaliaceticus]|uniref:phosphate ABC transporter substrate-binding protein n=1 Tax=Candidatus Contubernalis alkaliaceticus TaxID=338645 RepID=UPI001F4C460C|nr:phosphate ABC transporter substrate-binding protein [Candidatus Contubernalis alkalaceticus]UNC93321.1 phosphate ABC transporter substrate-binding protein [Candidatus Contubernalis alkalaceticus]